jgi:D-alanyl-D-alanine carboxypeptidase
VTQKPNLSQTSSKSVKIWIHSSAQSKNGFALRWINLKRKVNRLFARIFPWALPPQWKRRIWTVWVVGWLLGIFTAVMPIAATHLTRSATIASATEAVAQTWESFGTTPAVDRPKATAGLTQPRLWSHAATLAAYLGHLPYPKPDSQVLAPFPNDSSSALYATHPGEFLHPDAAAALKSMIDAARADGVWIVLVSGFRDLATQHRLFEDRAAAHGSVEHAARSVAPPGYSEHHTGYAIDVTDASGLGFYAFEQTEAFRWMQTHAHEFGFELSFPKNNPQGIDYEPWHWRFVASPEAAKTFAAARSRGWENGG